MEQKKKDQDVLIVRDEQTGEIGVVAGLKSDGTPNLRPAKAEHAQDFLRFDRHGDVLDNFFANFFRQCKEPNRFGFYRIAVEGMENVVAVMKDLLKNPVGFRDVLAPHKVDTTKYEQAAAQQAQETPPEPEKEEKQQDEKYRPIDETQIDSEEFERRWGIRVEDLRQAGYWDRMLGHGKSPLITCHPEIGCATPFDRLWISSLTDKAIREGLERIESGNKYDNLYYAAKARSEADWLVGINATQAITIAAGRGTYSLGRVQTPTLAMVCERYWENKRFTPEPVWQVHFATSGTNNDSVVKFSSVEKWKEKAPAEAAYKALDTQRAVSVTKVERKETVQEPPLLYDLTTLQKEAKNIRFYRPPRECFALRIPY